MRKNPTKAEEILWENLRGRSLGGYKFRRQHVIGPFIADFACLDRRVIVEVDGDIHNDVEQEQNDANRDLYLAQVKGFKVLRFTNNQVEDNTQAVLKSISIECKQRTSQLINSENEKLISKLSRDGGTTPISLRRGVGGEVEFKYPSYVQDILGPMCFDYGFGPFRWVCCSCKEEDLEKTDRIAQNVLEELNLRKLLYGN